MAICIVCGGQQYIGDCDLCDRVLCDTCKTKIHSEIKLELENKRKRQKILGEECQWCIGTTHVESFCDKCKSEIDTLLQKHLKLGNVVLHVKYGLLPVTREMVRQKSKKWAICKCFSGINCSCFKDVKYIKKLIYAKYNITGYKIYPYVDKDFDPQYDSTGSCCNFCKA
jgi:hypothetical protein